MIFIFLKVLVKANFLDFLIFLNEYFDLENDYRLILTQQDFCLSLFHIPKFSLRFLKGLTNEKNRYRVNKISITFFEHKL